METLHEIKPRGNRGGVQTRCVCCGKTAELVALAAGFKSLGWCRQCEDDKQQPTFDLTAVTL